jgi:hypothetical protein
MEEEITNTNNYVDWVKWVFDAKKRKMPCLNPQVIQKF